MKKLIFSLCLFFTLSIILFTWSSIIFERTADVITFSNHQRKLLKSNVQVQKALVALFLGLNTQEEKFITQSELIIEDEIVKSKDQKTISELKSLHENIKNIEKKFQNKNPIHKKDVLTVGIKADKISNNLFTESAIVWRDHLSVFDDLIRNYESINSAMKLFQALCILYFAYLLFSLYKRRVSEIEKEKVEKLHGLMFSSLSESVIMCDQNGDITACNYSCSMLLGMDTRLIIGKNISQIFKSSIVVEPSIRKKYSVKGLDDLIKSAKSLNALKIQTIVDGNKKWLSVNSQPVAKEGDGNSFSVILSFIDISSVIEKEKTIEKQKAQLVESAKMQSIGEIAGGIAHEINNPLTIISITSERLSQTVKRDDFVEKETVTKAMDKVVRTVNRMSKIVRSLLSLSRGGDLDYQKIDTKSLLDISIDFCLPYLEKNEIELRLDNFVDDIELECHPTQISQVLLNLIKNSIDSISDLDEKWIELRATKIDNSIRFDVIDSGTGLSEEDKEKIMQPFFTTKPIGKGTGLGLSISKTIIESHQGTLDIDLTNKNTNFYFILPIINKTESSNDDNFMEAA